MTEDQTTALDPMLSDLRSKGFVIASIGDGASAAILLDYKGHAVGTTWLDRTTNEIAVDCSNGKRVPAHFGITTRGRNAAVRMLLNEAVTKLAAYERQSEGEARKQTHCDELRIAMRYLGVTDGDYLDSPIGFEPDVDGFEISVDPKARLSTVQVEALLEAAIACGVVKASASRVATIAPPVPDETRDPFTRLSPVDLPAIDASA